MADKKAIVDTDILTYYMKGNETVTENFDRYISENEFVYISRISVIEILGGLLSKQASKQIERFKDLLSKHHILDTTEVSAEISARIFAELRKKGKHSGNYDILIAGIAIANDLVLVTNNEKDYENIDGLTIENWTLKIQ